MLRVQTKLRILDFDIENRPLSYWYKDMPTAEVTAIAWSWLGDADVHCATLESWGGSITMLKKFLDAYREADIVTGHYIRKHDLPILNGACVEAGLGKLPAKLTSDTKLDLVRWGALPQSQEHLADMMGVSSAKYHMTQSMWREANRLRDGVDLTKKRVIDDVVQHKALRARLIEEGLLGAPRRWTPNR